MNIKSLWIILLVVFAAETAYVVVTQPLSGIFAELKNPDPWGQLAILDLLIALTAGLGWLWRDANTKGVSPLLHMALTLVSGSISLLTYLIRHGNSNKTAH